MKQSKAKAAPRAISILALICVLVGIDQLTKQLAIQTFRGKPAKRYLFDTFRFEYSENPGAFLSLGAGLSDSMRFWILAVAVFIFLLISFYYLLKNRNMPFSQTFGLTMIIGGGVSNLIDRMFRSSGRVIDFMNLGVGWLRTGIFNVADMAIMAGTFLLIWALWRTGEQPKESL